MFVNDTVTHKMRFIFTSKLVDVYVLISMNGVDGIYFCRVVNFPPGCWEDMSIAFVPSTLDDFSSMGVLLFLSGI